MGRSRGFTLLELMIVVTIIGVLSAIALPIYETYRVRAIRSAAQAFMVEVASKQEEYATKRWAYVGSGDPLTFGDDLVELGIQYGIPQDVAQHYDFTMEAVATPPSFFIEADPSGKPGVMQNDGVLRLNGNGLKTPKAKWGAW